MRRFAWICENASATQSHTGPLATAKESSLDYGSHIQRPPLQDLPRLLVWVMEPPHRTHFIAPTAVAQAKRSPAVLRALYVLQRVRLNLSSPEKQEQPGELIKRSIRKWASPCSGNSWYPATHVSCNTTNTSALHFLSGKPMFSTALL